MKITCEMEKDLKYLLDAVESFQKKYNGIYITIFHFLGEKNIVADATVSDDNINFESITKWSNGEYKKD